MFVSTEWSSSVRHRERDCVITNQFFVPFEIVKDVGEIGFLSGETSSHGTEELMAKTIRVREKYFSYIIAHDLVVPFALLNNNVYVSIGVEFKVVERERSSIQT